MRITCPNCGAQYEVPDEVIPSEGRDVQCSNCGDTWFQNRDGQQSAEAPVLAETDPPVPPETTTEDLPEPPAGAPPEPAAAPKRSELPDEIASVLREEAAHEKKLREAEALESQGDLGLDSLPADETSRRSQEARDRMARIRGEGSADPAPDNPPEAFPEPPMPDPPHPEAELDRRPTSRLPEVEEVNASLPVVAETDARRAARADRVSYHDEDARRGGFGRGFALIVLIAVLLLLAYVNADQIVAAFPASESVMTGYVDAVQSVRIWLDDKLREFAP